MECLNDFEISSFIDGACQDVNRTVEHLNRCSYCFELTILTMKFISDNPKLCQEIDKAYGNAFG